MSVNWTRRTATAALLAVMAAAPGLAQSIPDITGTYRANGRNSDGTTYSGQAAIMLRGNMVEMAWQIGNDEFSGTGTFDGQVLRVNWGAAYPVVYVLMPDGALHGTWDNGRALERLSR